VTEPVPIRDAATVVLLRDGADGADVWLLTRVDQMVFASGTTVFPGGRVDPDDADLPWTGQPPDELAARLGCDAVTARTLVGAAVRETFEETGVLLTDPPASLADRPNVAADVEAGRIRFGDLLRDRGLAVAADLVHPWARWVTPVGEVRRYDTRFFVAELPYGAEPADLTSESSTAGWVAVRDALIEGDRGERILMPPTAAVLRSVAAHSTVRAALAAADSRDLTPVRPMLRRDQDGAFIVLPDGSSLRLPRRAP
jgi:8-oxo-dGTP pyrophosphatase MutT (NUDIX family)